METPLAPEEPSARGDLSFMETTLILLKPDCVTKGLCGEVLSRFEKAGYTLRGAKFIKLADALLAEHYAHIKEKPFFPDVVAFMTSSPVLVLALAAEGAIQKARDLLGPTDSTKAAKGTIRGDFGKDMMRNIAHASDGLESAEAELRRFFNADELVPN